MNKEEGKKRVFGVRCPNCHSELWIDPVTQEVIKSEKSKKEKGSLDELLLKEKKKKEEFERKFEATSELQKEKQRKAREIFERALTNIGKEEKEER
jgi:hypothetical protein